MIDLVNIRSIGVVLFLLATAFCVCEICAVESDEPQARSYTNRLKLVSIFSRHGDRGPSDELPKEDKHAGKLLDFWPDGLTNLTDMGRTRLFMVGVDTRRQYDNFLDFDSSKILALSSGKNRCQESLRFLLKGLYNIEWTAKQGQALLSRIGNCSSCLSSGSGFPDEWKRVPIDTETVPFLNWKVFDNCRYKREHPSPIDSNLLASPMIGSLKGIHLLKDTLKRRYNLDFDFGCVKIWFIVASELGLIRTRSTIEYTDHFSDWINQNVTVRGDAALTLLDVFEQVTLILFRERLDGVKNLIQSGSLLTSLIESQMLALGQNVTSKQAPTYKDKKMIIYMTHDTILQGLLYTMGIIHEEGSFEDRFFRYYNSGDEEKFLASLKMSSYGVSTRFELWEMESEKKNDKFAYVQLSLYDKEDPKFQPIEYKRLKFGSICRRVFLKMYKGAVGELARFYNPTFEIDKKMSCPFELLRNITAQYMIDDKKIDELCF